MTDYHGELLSVEDLRLLEHCEDLIGTTYKSLPDCGRALMAIHGGLWRATDPTWEQYLRRRWRMTPRMASYIMVTGGTSEPKSARRTSVGVYRHLHELDATTDAITASLMASGCATTFHVEQSIGYLRAVREIVMNLATEHPQRMDYRPWLHGLKDLAVALKKAFEHVRSDSDPRDPGDDSPIPDSSNSATIDYHGSPK